MAKVSVRMFATVREAAGRSELKVEADDLAHLLRLLGKSRGPRLSKLLSQLSSGPDRLVVLVNGRNIGRTPHKDVELSDGDEVAIFPPVSGG